MVQAEALVEVLVLVLARVVDLVLELVVRDFPEMGFHFPAFEDLNSLLKDFLVLDFEAEDFLLQVSVQALLLCFPLEFLAVIADYFSQLFPVDFHFDCYFLKEFLLLVLVKVVSVQLLLCLLVLFYLLFLKICVYSNIYWIVYQISSRLIEIVYRVRNNFVPVYFNLFSTSFAIIEFIKSIKNLTILLFC